MRSTARAAIAAQDNAKLIVASAHLPIEEKGGWSRAAAPDRVTDPHAADELRGEGYKMHGRAAIFAIIQEARDRAKAAGAKDIEERAVAGAPVDVLVNLAKEVNARPDRRRQPGTGHDRRASTFSSVPTTVARRVKIDILIVHTVG